MSARRVLAGSALALILPATLLATVETGSAASTNDNIAASVAKRKAGKQRVTLEVLPQIVHQGKRVAGASSARAAITATIKPAKIGRKVKLQVQRGTRWRTVSTLKQRSGNGRVEFAAAASRGGQPLNYRVQAVRFKGLKAVTSNDLTTEKWLNATWTDEFYGRTLGSQWSHRGQTYEKASMRLCSKGSPKAVRISRGAARISVLKDRQRSAKCAARVNGKVAGKFAYRLNGHIGTMGQANFKYGFAAARMKMHKLRGQHSSFWLLPESGNGPHSKGHEIDVIEYFGDNHSQGGITSFLHWYNGTRLTKTGSWIKQPQRFLANGRDGWSKNYHVFSVEWTPTKYVFRIDGKETWRTSRKISSDPQYVVLSLLASDYEIPQMKDKQLPQHMYVDWVRIWQDPAHSVG